MVASHIFLHRSGRLSSTSLGVGAWDKPFEMSVSNDHDNTDSRINLDLGEEPGFLLNYLGAWQITVKGRGRRSILELPLKTKIVIHDCLIS